MSQTTKMPQPKDWSRMGLSEFLKQTSFAWQTLPATNSSGTTTIKWYDAPRVIPEKKLTEKQLFVKLKKELKQVSVKLN